MVGFIKYSFVVLLVVIGISESQIGQFFSNIFRTELDSQNDPLDSRVVGVWVMVLKVVDGQIEYDESIEKNYTYNFQKNGNYIIDLRALRSNESFRNMSIVDLPHFKWKTFNGVLEITAFSSIDGKQIPSTDRKDYYFKGDTLVRSVSRFEYYYLKEEGK